MADKYLGIPLPTPTKNEVPSTDIRDHLFAGAKLDEEATSASSFYTDRMGVMHLTNSGRNNKFQEAQVDRIIQFNNQMASQNNKFTEQLSGQEDRFDKFLRDSGYVDIGDYTDGPLTLTERNQILSYNGELWRVNAETALPFTTTGNTSSSWENDATHFVSVGDAALRQELASTESPSSMIGNFFAGDGKEQAGYVGESLRERLLRRGQFGAVQSPGDQPYLAGHVFGDSEGNLGGLTVDARGRASTHAVSGGHITATGIGLPFCELTGHYNGQFPNVTMKAHSPLVSDDNLMPGLMWVWDGDERKERLLVTSPFNPGNDGYPIDGYNEHVNLLASYYDIGYGLNHSFDHFNTTDIAARQWGKVCTIKPGTSGGSVKKFSALITAGSYVNYEQGTFLLDVNGQNLIDTITSGNMNRGSIGQWIKFVRLSDSTNVPATMNYIPEVGVIVNTSTGNAEVWLKLPYYSPRVSVTVLAMSNPTYVQVDWSDWKTNSLRTTEPGGITYAMTSYPVNSQNYVKTNSGQVVYAPNKVLRVKDVMSASSTYNRMSEFLEYGFSQYGTNFAVNRYMGAGISVTKNSTGTYSVSGCTLSGTNWKVKPPVSWSDGGSAGIVAITSTSSGAFSFTLKDSAGNLIDIPDGTWIDFHVS